MAGKVVKVNISNSFKLRSGLKRKKPVICLYSYNRSLVAILREKPYK